ncbi:hypothetical protein M758_11G069300 [Ceratodon purpureus]|nr:hypothetical protein M758_11G069300 [Ceratodon purpureus]
MSWRMTYFFRWLMLCQVRFWVSPLHPKRWVVVCPVGHMCLGIGSIATIFSGRIISLRIQRMAQGSLGGVIGCGGSSSQELWRRLSDLIHGLGKVWTLRGV